MQYQNSFWSQIVNSISTKINQKKNRYITESLAFQFESKLSRFEVSVTVHHEATDDLIHAFSLRLIDLFEQEEVLLLLR